MVIIKPEDIKFENANDVIDYVTLGLPPTRANYEKVRKAIGEYPISAESEITISKGAFFELDRKNFQIVLDRVYRDNCRNRNILIGVGAAVLIGGIFAIACGNKKEEENSLKK